MQERNHRIGGVVAIDAGVRFALFGNSVALGESQLCLVLWIANEVANGECPHAWSCVSLAQLPLP